MGIDYNKLKIGDRLVRNKGGILSKHHALYVGYQNHSHWVAENQIGHGVRYFPLHHFLMEGKLDRVEYYNFDRPSQAEILNRVDDKIGTPYSIFRYNCEHFVSEVLEGVAESKQIKNGVVITGAIAFFLIALSANRTTA